MADTTNTANRATEIRKVRKSALDQDDFNIVDFFIETAKEREAYERQVRLALRGGVPSEKRVSSSR